MQGNGMQGNGMQGKRVGMQCRGETVGTAGNGRKYLVKVVDCVALRAQVGAWDVGDRLTRLLVAEVAANSAPQQRHGGRLDVCRVNPNPKAHPRHRGECSVFWAGATGHRPQGHFCHRPGWRGCPVGVVRVGAAMRTRATKVLGLSLLLVDVHRHRLAAPALLPPN
jgi:hypothetical protein